MIELIGLAILSVLFTEWFEPIQEAKNYLKAYSWPYIGKILYCGKCFGLWFGLAMTFNIYESVIVSLLSYTISFLIDLMEKHRYDN